MTTPEAEVVRTICVATPWVRVTATWFEVSAGLAREAVTYFGVATLPTNFKPSKVAIPAEAFCWRVPVRSDPERVI